MTLNTFADIVSLAKKRCNISGVTDFDDIITTALNEAYIELKKEEPTIVKSIAFSINGIVTLPEDCDSLLSITPELYADEYKKGNSIVLKREEDETFEITYSAVPDPLIDTDIPEVNKKYWYPMSTYGCYAYYNFKKKHNEAQAYMQEYLTQINKLDSSDMLPNQIQNVYSSLLG